jgi:hypothetical protein
MVGAGIGKARAGKMSAKSSVTTEIGLAFATGTGEAFPEPPSTSKGRSSRPKDTGSAQSAAPEQIKIVAPITFFICVFLLRRVRE